MITVAFQIEGWNVIDGITLSTRKLFTFLNTSSNIHIHVFTWMHPDCDMSDTPELFKQACRNPDLFDFTLVGIINLKGLLHDTGIYHWLSWDRIRIHSKIKNIKPHALHSMTPFGDTLHAFISYSNTHHIPLYMSYRSDFISYTRTFHYSQNSIINSCIQNAISAIVTIYIKDIFSQATKIVVLSPYFYDLFRRLLPSSDIATFPHGVDFQQFFPIESKQHLRSQLYEKHTMHADINNPLILWVSRVVSTKLPDRWQRLVDRIQLTEQIHAVALGDGAMLHKMPKHTWIGNVSHDDVARWMQCADIFLFPSPVETFGNVTLEALASGCKVVIHEQPGWFLLGEYMYSLNDNIKRYRYGWTVSSDNDDDWFMALNDALNTEHYAMDQVQYVRDNFSIESCYNRYIDMYIS